MTGKRLIIGIGHKARQGKDTAAEHLRAVFGCRITHFAKALYEECRNATILFRDTPPVLYLKTDGEDFFPIPEPGGAITAWIRKNGLRKENLPYGAGLFYGGMTDKDAVLLQFWGTEFRRKHFSWNYWVDKVRTEIAANPADDFIIPDTRFRNEAQMIKDIGGYVWKIDRVGYKADDRDPNHTSEIDLDGWKFDSVFLNDGSIADLWVKVEAHYRTLKGLRNGREAHQQG